MAWERRTRGSRYYTRSLRVGGRVVRDYVGGGIKGEVAAAEDAARRAARQEKAEAWGRECARLEALDRAVAELDEAVGSLVTASLLIAGYHRHHRGNWRRRRAKSNREELETD
jgi:hypothetical protein